MSDRLVQTRIPPALFAKIANRAAEEGESVAGWLRRLLFRELAEPPAFNAWFVTESGALLRNVPPTCRLAPVGAASASERLFVLLPAPKRPLATIPIRARTLVFIEGSSSHWEIVSHFEDAGAVQLGLRARGTFLDQPQPPAWP